MSGIDGLFKSLDVSASGLTAQRFRMEIIGQNLAYAEVDSSSPAGRAYRRRSVAFHAILDEAARGGTPAYRGVSATARVDRTPGMKVPAPSDLPAGHPGVDADGNIEKSNVQVHREMIELLHATRTYEANLAAVKAFREMVGRALTLGRMG
jgi:flagellar basal-body rod protein FlgC